MGSRENYYRSLSLAERLKYLRETREFTQSEIADILCIDRSTYSYYELGKTEPRLSSIMKLAKLYGLSLDRMLAGLLELGGK